MNGAIRILPPEISNKIAAGEVVQRPASVLKELLENSLDAGATSATVLLKDAGKALIQVIDNGSGMAQDDVPLAFARHATSKIASYADLEEIHTFGFRGEALASIAAVARVELKTRRAADPVGIAVSCGDGAVSAPRGEAMSVGTSIAVKNLFYNTPGRRNFLKTNSTEFHHCLAALHRVALAYPDLRLVLYSDEEKILDLQPEDRTSRLSSLFGKQTAHSSFPFEDSQPYVRISGFLGKPDFSRKTRAEQYLFLNRRPITNRSVSFAVLKGYEHLLEKGSFPFSVLFIDIDPKKVDVNVHPSKMEVKFEDESAIYRHVFHAVRRALGAHNLLPILETEQKPGADLPAFSGARPDPASGARITNWRELISPGQPGLAPVSAAPSDAGHPVPDAGLDRLAQAPPAIRPAPAGAQPGVQDIRLVQIHKKYILMPIEGGFMLVDQHAAHERVLYERIASRFERHEPSTQQLLFPLVNEFSGAEVELLKDLRPLLEDLGFAIKMFGGTTVILDGVPTDVSPGYEKTILRDLLDLYREDNHSVTLEPRERLAQSYACRAAIKSGDSLGQAEMQSLLDQLFATSTPYVCPHGRPVSIRISLTELDRRFGRLS